MEMITKFTHAVGIKLELNDPWTMKKIYVEVVDHLPNIKFLEDGSYTITKKYRLLDIETGKRFYKLEEAINSMLKLDVL